MLKPHVVADVLGAVGYGLCVVGVGIGLVGQSALGLLLAVVGAAGIAAWAFIG